MCCLESSLNVSLLPNDLSQNTVGQRQNVICSISIPPYVNPETVELGWLYGEEIVTDDSRVNINLSNDHFNDGTLVTIIEFNVLIQEDEDKQYICYAIINGSLLYKPIGLHNFTSKPLFKCTHVCMQHSMQSILGSCITKKPASQQLLVRYIPHLYEFSLLCE